MNIPSDKLKIILAIVIKLNSLFLIKINTEPIVIKKA